MIELALTILAFAFLVYVGFWILVLGFGVVLWPFMALKELADRRSRNREESAAEREWLARTAHLTESERKALEREADEFFKGC